VEATQMNFISKWFDRVHLIFIQFTETLSTLEDPGQFLLLLPPVHPERVLVLNYNLPPPYVFFILRGSLKNLE
jgi:hypothetical protein